MKPTSSLSPAQKTFKVVWELEAEVNNGGFAQYFSNSSGRDAPRAEAALRAIGADNCADLVAEAIGTVDGDGLNWANDARRQSRIDSLAANAGDLLNALDEKFYEYPDPLSELLTNFVAHYPNDFPL